MLGITSEYVIRSARAPQFSALRFVGPAFVTALTIKIDVRSSLREDGEWFLLSVLPVWSEARFVRNWRGEARR
jgi:hypothetical protein